MAKKFFHICGGILMLALAYHFGATSAGAQAPGNSVVGISGFNLVVTANGDVYQPLGGSFPGGAWVHSGNVFSGPTPVQPTSFGALKAKYR